MTLDEYKLLRKINSPRDLKQLSAEELRTYCDELRSYIIDECSVNPGHLASSLGCVELAAALHYVFDTPADKIVWDVGHQTYAHKIITGRREAFKTKRLLGGISGFPRMSESPYDAFGGGHASVSISAAFGMAKAAEMRGERHQVVAVIGDGSMTGGLAFEGLNNAGASKRTNILVILNDNNMAIDQATGALKNYLLKISTSVHYNRFKQQLWGILSHTPRLLRLCQKAGNAVKQGVLNKSNLFESFNFRYFGPVDGHNLKELVRTLQALRDIEGPKLLHVMTVKGKGYLPAEHDQSTWHAPGRFNPDTGERIASPANSMKWSVPPEAVMRAMMWRIMSLASVPEGSVPSTVMRIARGLPCRMHWLASTISTSEVPTPKATAPSAPCVEVWLSPQTIVMPGCVSPSSGPMMCTIPCRGSPMPKCSMP